MYDDILLPVDLGDESSWREALPAALELRRSPDARLHVMTVVPGMGSAWVAGFFPDGFERRRWRRRTPTWRPSSPGTFPTASRRGRSSPAARSTSGFSKRRRRSAPT